MRQIFLTTYCFLIAGSSFAPGQTAMLAYKFREGEIDRYRETSSTTVSAETMPGGKQIFHNETYSTQRVAKVNPDGTAEVIRTIDSTISTMNGRPFENPNTSRTIGFSLRLKVSPTGKTLEVRSVKDSLDEMEKGVLEAFRGQLMSQPGFPTHPLEVGDRWQDSTTLIQQTPMGSLTTEFNYSTTLKGTDTLSSQGVWILKTVVSLVGTIAQGAGSIHGMGEGSVYFSEGLGKEIKNELQVNQTMEVTSPQGSMTMNMKTSSTRELIR